MSKEAQPPVPQPPATGDVVAIVVNYGTADLALAAVGSLLDPSLLDPSLPDHSRLAHVHLVDNASPGGDGLRLAAEIAARGWGAQVTLWAETVNHGFGRGNNLVIDRLLAEGGRTKVFLLNPDAQVTGDALGLLAAFLDDHPGVGAVGARIEKPQGDGPPCPVTAAFRFPSLVSIFAQSVGFGPVTRLFAAWTVALPPDQPTGPVDWVSGAAVMFRLEALRAVGGFDPDFFLYHEEVELMHRLARGGWQTWHLAEALALHAEGAATGVRSNEGLRKRRPGYWYVSWRHYMTKTHGRSGALLAAGLWMTGATLNHVIAALRRRPPAAPLQFYGDLWTHVLHPLLRPPLRPTHG